MALNEYVCGPQGAAVPLTLEQKFRKRDAELVGALAAIASEAHWAKCRRGPANQAAMERIRQIIDDLPNPTYSATIGE